MELFWFPSHQLNNKDTDSMSLVIAAIRGKTMVLPRATYRVASADSRL